MSCVGRFDCSFMKGWSKIRDSFNRCAGCCRIFFFYFNLSNKFCIGLLHALTLVKHTFFSRQFMRSFAHEDRYSGSLNSADTTLFKVLFTPSIYNINTASLM